MHNLDKLPLHFTIQRPGPIARGVGIESTKGPNGCWLQSRGVKIEKRRAQIAAELCGITFSEFLRRALQDLSEEVIKAATANGVDIEEVNAIVQKRNFGED